jgi:hypothetical protein
MSCEWVNDVYVFTYVRRRYYRKETREAEPTISKFAVRSSSQILSQQQHHNPNPPQPWRGARKKNRAPTNGNDNNNKNEINICSLIASDPENVAIVQSGSYDTRMCGIGTEQHSQTATHSGRSVSLVSASKYTLFHFRNNLSQLITFRRRTYSPMQTTKGGPNKRWTRRMLLPYSNALHQRTALNDLDPDNSFAKRRRTPSLFGCEHRPYVTDDE